MNIHKLTVELEADLRAKINPQYADWKGTESWERKTLFGEIDRLRAQRDELRRKVELYESITTGHEHERVNAVLADEAKVEGKA